MSRISYKQIWLMNNTKDAHLSRQAEAGKNSRSYDAGSLLCKANCSEHRIT